MVQWKYDSLMGDWNYRSEVPLHTSRVKIEGLRAFTQYRFRVAWLVLPNFPPLLSEPSVVISTLAYGKPTSSPSITSLVATNPSQISVTWEPPKFPNGRIVSYTLQLTEYLTKTVTIKDISVSQTNKSSQSLHYMFNGLKPNTRYTLSIAARNHAGEGPKEERNITTMTAVIAELPEDESKYVIFATNNEIRKQDPADIFESKVLFRLTDFSKTETIGGLAIHIERRYVFVSDSSRTIRRISLKETSKQTRSILKNRLTQPSHLSVDWLNDKLYIVDDSGISRCNLDGQHFENVIISSEGQISDMKVDPYNGYLYWISRGEGLRRVDLALLDINHLDEHDTQLIFQDSWVTNFAVDYDNYRLYLPLKRERSIFSLTIDGFDLMDIRNNAQKAELLEDVNNLVFYNNLFYWTTGGHVFLEEYDPNSSVYHHNSVQVENTDKIVALLIQDERCQPYPVPLNPVINVQAIFLDTSAKIFWDKPKLLGGIGLGAWQQWSFEVNIEEMLSGHKGVQRGLNQTDCVAHELKPATDYSIKVRAYSKAGNGTWSAKFHGKTLKKIRSFRYPFALWSTKDGLLKSNLIGDKAETLIYSRNFNNAPIKGKLESETNR